MCVCISIYYILNKISLLLQLPYFGMSVKIPEMVLIGSLLEKEEVRAKMYN